MKIKIDKSGDLWISRPVKMKKQECHDRDDMYCGDWCPLFGEPEERHEPIYGDGIGPVNAIELSICKRTLRCKPEDFEDER